jgi:hypothetical protein
MSNVNFIFTLFYEPRPGRRHLSPLRYGPIVNPLKFGTPDRGPVFPGANTWTSCVKNAKTAQPTRFERIWTALGRVVSLFPFLVLFFLSISYSAFRHADAYPYYYYYCHYYFITGFNAQRPESNRGAVAFTITVRNGNTAMSVREECCGCTRRIFLRDDVSADRRSSFLRTFHHFHE